MKILASKNGKAGTASKKSTSTKVNSDLRVVTTVNEEGKATHNLNFGGAWKKLGLDSNGIIFTAEAIPTLLVVSDTNSAVMSFGKTKKSENAKSKFVKADNFTNILMEANLISGEEIDSKHKLTNYLSLVQVENEPVEGLEGEYSTYQVVAATKTVDGITEEVPYTVEEIKTPSAETVAKIMASRNKNKEAQS